MIRIDTDRAVLEPFFDGGDSYKGHQKYSYLTKYTVCGAAAAVQNWDSVLVRIAPKGTGSLFRTLPTEEDLSLFDTVTAFLACPDTVVFRLYFDGKLVMETRGKTQFCVHDALLPAECGSVSEIRMEFENTLDREQTASIYYIGADNRSRPKLPVYTGTWEGCFSDSSDTALFDSDYYTEEELDGIREEVHNGAYRASYADMKKRAESYLDKTPETEIAKTLSVMFRTPEHFVSEAETLAFVGAVERDARMMKTACRYMLCMAACPDWCADPMENAFPLVWHHRSFHECEACAVLSFVLSLCGRQLTWHGRNVLYQALIMKGLPRIDADLMTMDYIYYMNQGFAFIFGYIRALITLSHAYPRYEKKVDAAEELLFEMLEKAQNADGSTDEGPGYWNYSFQSALFALLPLARRRGADLCAYAGEILRKTGNYGIFMLDRTLKTITISDCGSGGYSPLLSNCFAQITNDPRWRFVCENTAASMPAPAALAYRKTLPPSGLSALPRETFEDFPVIGMTAYTPVKTPYELRLLCVSGKSNNTHCHEDKGGIVLYRDNLQLLCDRGTLPYNEANAEFAHRTAYHNAAVPVTEDGFLTQYCGKDYSASYAASCENGTFVWESDQTALWDPALVKKNTRRVEWQDGNSFTVTDHFSFTAPTAVAVSYHSAVPDMVKLEAVTGAVRETEETDSLSCPHVTPSGESSKTVWVRRFRSAPAPEVTVVTRVTLL